MIKIIFESKCYQGHMNLDVNVEQGDQIYTNNWHSVNTFNEEVSLDINFNIDLKKPFTITLTTSNKHSTDTLLNNDAILKDKAIIIKQIVVNDIVIDDELFVVPFIVNEKQLETFKYLGFNGKYIINIETTLGIWLIDCANILSARSAKSTKSLSVSDFLSEIM